MENLRELHLDRTTIEELPSSIEHLNRLEILNLQGCQELVTLLESICNLGFHGDLNVNYRYKLEKLPQNLGRLKSLMFLYASGLNSRCCRLLSFPGLCSLYSLQVLYMSYCKIDEEEITSEIWRLSSLIELHLNANRFRSIPTWINQLSMLRVLSLSHCLGLVQIVDLLSSLQVLDLHGCILLETSLPLISSSLFKFFE